MDIGMFVLDYKMVVPCFNLMDSQFVNTLNQNF